MRPPQGGTGWLLSKVKVGSWCVVVNMGVLDTLQQKSFRDSAGGDLIVWDVRHHQR